MEYWKLFVKGFAASAYLTGRLTFVALIFLLVGHFTGDLAVDSPKLVDATVSDLMKGAFLFAAIFWICFKD